MQKNIKIGLLIVLLIIMFIGLGVLVVTLINNQRVSLPTGNGSERIVVKSIDEKINYGYITVESEKIKTSITVSDVSSYILKNKYKWETADMSYPTGGMTADGALWDGLATTSIDKEDFLNAVYVQLSSEFSQKYSIDLE